MSMIKIYYRKPTDLERIGINAANAAALAASTTAIRFIKSSAYSQRLSSIDSDLSNEDMLSLDGSKSPYTVSAGSVLRNVLMLSTQDDSLQIQFIDVKIDVGQVITIKQTPLTHKKGTVKEEIQANDHDISVKGNLISDTQEAFPYDMFQSMIKLLKELGPFKVASKYLEAFDISRAVLKRYTFPQSQQKFVNVMPFGFNLISDEDYELQID